MIWRYPYFRKPPYVNPPSIQSNCLHSYVYQLTDQQSTTNPHLAVLRAPVPSCTIGSPPRLVLGLQLLQVSGTVLPLSKETVPAMHLGPAGSVELRGGKQKVELAGINQLGLPDNLWETKCQWSIIILHCVGGNQPSCLDKTMFFWENKWVGNRWVGVVGCLSNFELGFLKECPPKSGWVSAQKQQVGRNDLFCIILRSAFSGYTCGAIPLAKQDFHL